MIPALLVIALIAVVLAFRLGLNRGRAQGLVAGVLIAQEDEEPADPIADFLERQRVASSGGLQ